MAAAPRLPPSADVAMLRAVEGACGIVWRDDAQIVIQGAGSDAGRAGA